MPEVRRVTYRRGMIKTRNDRRGLCTTTFEGNRLPQDVRDLVARNALQRAAGIHGDPRLGQPIQYDHLEIEYDGSVAQIEVFNRAIMLFASTNQDIVRIHQVCCRLEDLEDSSG